MAALLQRLRGQKPWRGRFTYDPTEEGGAPYNWQLEEEKNGIVTIFKEPEKGVPYVLGGDTAGEGSDSFTAYVMDNRTGEQVAELKMEKSELEYARQIYCTIVVNNFSYRFFTVFQHYITHAHTENAAFEYFFFIYYCFKMLRCRSSHIVFLGFINFAVLPVF